MNWILQSWTLHTHLVFGSLLGPMTPLIDLALTLSLMNLGITPISEFQTLNILDASSQPMTLFPTLSVNQCFLEQQRCCQQ